MTQNPANIIYLRIPAELYEKVRTRADTDRRTINMTVRMLLESALLDANDCTNGNIGNTGGN